MNRYSQGRRSLWAAAGAVTNSIKRRRDQLRAAGVTRQVPAEALEARVLMARDLYVDIASAGPAHDGSSWGSAYVDLQLALAAASAGDRILVADGTYKPTTTTDRGISFQLKEGVNLLGGYAGYGAANPDGRNVALYRTVLSGDIGQSGSNGDNSYNVVTFSGVISAATTVDGLTITGGNASGTTSQTLSGGGMFLGSASPTLVNCTFAGNTARGDGGAIYSSGSSPALINCTFSGNSADGYGGAIYASNSWMTLTNSTFGGNAAGVKGGAIYNYRSGPRLVNCIVWGSGNSPIFNDAGSTTITYSDIEGGYAGAGNINSDPLFVRSVWTGPDGLFGTGDDDYGDLRLRVGSPALDVGSNAAIPSGISADSRGNARIQNGTVDLGACEGPALAPTAKTLYVDVAAAAAGADSGVSWSNAFTSLQSALLAATDGDTIRVADGTYMPIATADRTFSFALRNAVVMYGGYAGYGAANPDDRDIAVYPTILSGDIGVAGDSTDNSYHVVSSIGLSGTAVLDGFTITAGNANGSPSNNRGGGMYNPCSSPTLANCTFIGNTASSYGGGMYNSWSAPTLTNCTFSGNGAHAANATGWGGGMSNSSSVPTLIGCTFSGNTAGYGGGMFNDASSPALTNCTFTRNVADGNSSAGSGGGMYNHQFSSPTLTNCTFSANAANGGGGICNNYYSSPALTNSTFVANTDKAIYNSYSSPTLTNCTFGGNVGGAMYSDMSSPQLTNCVVWGNGSSPISGSFGTPVITYSDIEGGYAGAGNISSDPLFIRSPWTGPDGLFGTADDDYGDLRLRTGSPAVDAGSNAAIPAGVGTDLQGNVRIQNSTVDLGAYEGSTAIVAKTVYVDLAAVGANTGASWTDAFTDLQSALLVTADGDTIRVADGAYKPTATTDRKLSFVLRNALRIYGGYAGSGAADPNARDVVAYPTVLSGDIGAQGANADNSYHVVLGSGIASTTILDGLTVTAGNANGGGSDSYGGGVYNTVSWLTLSNCTIRGNWASAYGGGMYNVSSLPTLSNCRFSGNTAVGTSASGGGMYNSYSSPSLTNCTFSGNTVSGSFVTGGGMANSFSSPALLNCTFSGNSAAPNAAAGGVYNSSSSPQFTNSLFIGNSASQGSAMYNETSSSPILTNCTLSGNQAASGRVLCNASSSSPTLTNCIIWGSGNGPIYNVSSTTTITYSDIQGGYAGTGNVNTDPLFIRNPSSGADGVWGTADDDLGDLHLHRYSPLVDAGNPGASGLVGITADFGGNPRFADIPTTTDTGSGAPPIIDMGAYEAQPAVEAFVAGPHKVRGGQTVSLSALGSGAVAGPLTFAWDFDNDGLYDDASGPNPVFSTVGCPAPATVPVTVRVTDAGGGSATASTTVTVVPPVLYVDDSATGTGDGSTWANAFTDLQSALSMALGGCEIRVAGGIYKPTNTDNRAISFQLSQGVVMRGGYAGVGAADPDARDLSLYPSILSGDIGQSGDRADNSYHVVTGGSGISAITVFDGFTITAGNANGTSVASFDSGGGICLFSASPTILNSRFVANFASYDGGAMLNSASSPSLVNCVFVGNSATYGGAIKNRSSSRPVLTNCTIVANTATYYGGGMYDATSYPVLPNSIIWGNSAFSYGQVDWLPTITFSDIQDGYPGTGNINADPLFVRDPSAGDDGTWGTADDDYGDLHLQSCSPSIDAGDNAAAGLAGVNTDAGGDPRIDGGIVDMGAYESQQGSNLPGQLTITGTNEANTITITASAGRYTITVDGVTSDVAIASVASISISAFGGNDTVTIGAGVQGCTILGGAGNDTITGGDGSDSIDAGTGNDLIIGGSGDDTLTNQDGGDTILGGDGSDTIRTWCSIAANGQQSINDSIDGGAGDDRIEDTDVLANPWLEWASIDTLIGGAGNDTILGGDAMDALPCEGGGSDVISGGGGLDFAYYPYTTDSLSMSNDDIANDGPAGTTDNIGSDVEALFGGAGNDVIRLVRTGSTSVMNNLRADGGAGDDTIYGSDSPDWLSGDSGNDSISGGAGADTIDGGDGDDQLWGDIGPDSLGGGGGMDTLDGGLGFDTMTSDADDQVSDPTRLVLDNVSITEGQAVGALVGHLSVVGGDPGDTFIYGFVSGDGSDSNAKFALAGSDLYSNEVFDFETCTGYSIRVGVTGSSGAAMESVFAVLVTDVDEISPSVISTAINDGAAQRSMVRKVSIVFSEPVALLADALVVRLSDGTLPPNTTVTVANPSGDQKTYVVTFSGSGAVGGSLADGTYDLVVSSTGVQDLAGNVLTASYTQHFHRLFGDSDGNKIVNALDYARLKNALGRAPTDPLFNSALDYEANNLINALDLARFRQRYGMSFSY